MDNNSQNKPSGGGSSNRSKPGKNTGRKRRYNNNKKRGARPNSGNNTEGGASASSKSTKPRRNNNRRKTSSKNVSTSKVVQHYDTLLEQHLVARKKYYELFFRADPNQKRKLDKKFISTVESLRKYESELKPWQQEQLDKRVNFGKLDTTFSQNYDLDPFECDEAPEEYEEIHMTPAQRERSSYSEDTEESSGTIEDYKKYKGIVD